ncbi:MAG: polyprenyl synthetase family protein [Desulfobulbaceae bacterium]|uniref:Polyprenyl synthetase family protein n=1 Tax=Candidatus Desulfatifera sulfidica TaxID=2841691 RepID=A0A8J6TDX1_9BACT|nr:polyprenyl synthetase family protein [Candidatus Desulfatifera sulfidica]
MKTKQYLNEQRLLVEKALAEYMLPAEGLFRQHIEAMRYSLFAGGKRIRPILCLAAGRAVDDAPAVEQALMPAACALECIHTYSLIHDDLPAMDDDELRRGKATNHILFGEAEAILAGDGLHAFAFDLISNRTINTLAPERLLAMTHCIARAAGSLGMVGGQALDIANENRDFPFETLRDIHRSKTGALIKSSVLAGALGAGADSQQIQALDAYGRQIGLAFQIVDDLLNATATTEQLGKAAGSDAERGKATYPAYFGITETRNKAREAVELALTALKCFDHKAEPLRGLARYIETRSH